MTGAGAGSATLVDQLRSHARHKPDETALTFLVDGEDQEESISFGELDAQARRYAAALQEVTQPGERALLVYPSGLAFIEAFLGCLYAGVLAVPVNTPHLRRDAPRLRLVMRDSQPKVICAHESLIDQTEKLKDQYPELAGLKWVTHEGLLPGAEAKWSAPAISPSDPAFLQYTSGSTSDPKGNVISHSNLVSTIEDIRLGCDFGESSRQVSWLPMFHDLGLIYGLLLPIYMGGRAVFMAPVAFLEKPYRWLRAMTKHRGTHTGAPNSAYELCAGRITAEEKRTLDLRSMRAWAIAAEPVRFGTMSAFADAMRECGFRMEMFCPAFGLAEATLKVTAKRVEEGVSICSLDPRALHEGRLRLLPADDPKSYKSVGCGWSDAEADIRIVDPEMMIECAPDQVGEIWVRGGSVAQGYWGRAEETRETFRAQLANSGDGPFLRTGDLGFIHEDQLHVAGRIKDMVIVNGRNFYPQDIELTTYQADPALQPDGGAAFSMDDGESERLVVVQEVKRSHRKGTDFEGIAATMRMAIAREHGLRADAVALIRPGRLPKTTSGKVQRHAAREMYLNGDLQPLYEWRAPRKPAGR
jgi:acyl-CoA synthetase (AMP-forming)/AMP-acid ligase II